MPIEHEHKFVLNPTEELFAKMKDNYNPGFLITQFYVSDAARYRQILTKPDSTFGAEWVFAHKMAVDHDVLEHEIGVPHSDFMLAQKRALGTLYKIRFKAGGGWDVDFFLDGPHGFGQIYFAMAECEHTRGTSYEILPIIKDEILYAVPEEFASAFSNRKLTDIAYTRKILAEIRSSQG
jgi:hypothetical protein